MQDVRIVFVQPDGSVSVVHPAWRDRREGESEAAFLDRIERLAVPAGVDRMRVTASDLPAYDSDTRNRWRIEGGKVVIGPPLQIAQPVVQIDSLALIADLKRQIDELSARQSAMIAAIASADRGRDQVPTTEK